MNIKLFLFYLSIFVNKNERKSGILNIANTLVMKKIYMDVNKITKKITKEVKRHIPLIVNRKNLTEESVNDIFIMNIIKTAIE